MKTPRRAALLVLLLVCLGPAAAAPAGPAHLLVDANPAPPGTADFYPGYLPPTQFATVQGRVVFLVDSYEVAAGSYRPTLGPPSTLWASDGTPEGTELLAAFCADGIDGCHRGARLLGQAGGVELLSIPEVGYDNDFRRELWRTDGTPEGTYRLPAELCPQDYMGPSEVIAGGVLYFAGFDGASGCEAWRSDGTAAGTTRLEDLSSGVAQDYLPQSFAALGDRALFANAAGLWAVLPQYDGAAFLRALPGVRLITAAGNRLFFLSGVEGGEALWVSDGEQGGDTRQLQVFPEKPCRDCDSAIPFLKPVDGGVVFLVTDPRRGSRLWRSDGTAQGTHPVAGLPNPVRFGAGGPATPEAFVDLGSRLLFPASRKEGLTQLWVASPPFVSAAPLAGCPVGCPAGIFGLQPLPDGRRVVLTASAPRAGYALWVSDGTAAGTRPVIGAGQSVCASPSTGFLSLGDSLYFGAEDAEGPSLCRTDGTLRGTVPLARISLPFQPGGALLGDRVLLGAASGARTSELWSTGGSPAGTWRVRTFARAAASSDLQFSPFGEGVLFTARQGDLRPTLWKSDGASAQKLADLCPGMCDTARPPVIAGGIAFVLAGSAEDIGLLSPHLIRTDGTPAGTREILAQDFDFLADAPFSLGGRFFFLRCESRFSDPNAYLRRCGFWTSDGTPEGTVPRISLPISSYITPPVVAGASFYFFLYGREGVVSLFQSDGTQAGTRRLATPDEGGYSPEIVEAGGHVFLQAGQSLAFLDASAPQGVSVFFGSSVSGLQELGGRLLFFGSSGEDPARTGLWSTDGTLEGTRLLSPVLVRSPAIALAPPRWTRLGSRLLFRGWDPEHGFEPWVTDGTPEGTVLLKDVFPGEGSSFPDSLVLTGGQVWFTATDGIHGRELWVTGGTPEGTRLAVELAPGPFSLEPRALTPAGGNLFFSADSLFTGREPWVLPLQ
jgi:ELWxxDGT repeat protein